MIETNLATSAEKPDDSGGSSTDSPPWRNGRRSGLKNGTPDSCKSFPGNTPERVGGEDEKRQSSASADFLAQFDFLTSLTSARGDCPLLQTFKLPPNQPTLYFLLNHGSIVYVGMTRRMLSRIGQHLKHPPYPFDSVKFAPVPSEYLAWVEAELICRLQPRGNANVPEFSQRKMREALSTMPAIPSKPRKRRYGRKLTRLKNGGISVRRDLLIKLLRGGGKLIDAHGGCSVWFQGEEYRVKPNTARQLIESGKLVAAARRFGETMYLWSWDVAPIAGVTPLSLPCVGCVESLGAGGETGGVQ